MSQLDKLLVNSDTAEPAKGQPKPGVELLNPEGADLIRGGDKEYKPMVFQQKTKNNWLRGVVNIFS